MRRTKPFMGCAWRYFLNLFRRWESAELNQEEAAELRERADARRG